MDSLRDPALFKTALESFQTEQSGPFASGVQASAFLPIIDFISERGKTELQNLLEELPKEQKSDGIKSQHSLLNQALLDPGESSSQLMLLPLQVHSESAHDQQALFNPSSAGAYITLTAHIARPYHAVLCIFGLQILWIGLVLIPVTSRIHSIVRFWLDTSDISRP